MTAEELQELHDEIKALQSQKKEKTDKLLHELQSAVTSMYQSKVIKDRKTETRYIVREIRCSWYDEIDDRYYVHINVDAIIENSTRHFGKYWLLDDTLQADVDFNGNIGDAAIDVEYTAKIAEIDEYVKTMKDMNGKDIAKCANMICCDNGHLCRGVVADFSEEERSFRVVLHDGRTVYLNSKDIMTL